MLKMDFQNIKSNFCKKYDTIYWDLLTMAGADANLVEKLLEDTFSRFSPFLNNDDDDIENPHYALKTLADLVIMCKMKGLMYYCLGKEDEEAQKTYEVYKSMQIKADNFCRENLKGKDLKYYISKTI